jgi:opacity protein-like surface antigen
MKKCFIAFALFVSCLASALTAQANPSLSWTATYDADSGVGQYNYTIDQVDAGYAMTHFEIQYLYPFYAGLSLDSGLTGWSYDLTDPANVSGFTNGLLSATGVGLTAGEQLNFTMSFVWTDPTFSPIPVIEGDQLFYFETTSTEGTNVPVPEPSTVLLLCAGLAGLGVMARRRAAQKG